MVTLRYLHEQRDAAQRRARMVDARRAANKFEVERARLYSAQKELQAHNIQRDIEQRWLVERQKKSAFIDTILYEGEQRRGEGMRGAADLHARQRHDAINELSAWSVEHAFEEERHRLAAATVAVSRALSEEPRRRITDRKKAVRAAEDSRSKIVIAQAKHLPVPAFADAAKSSPLAGAIPQTLPPKLQERSPKVPRVVTANKCVASGGGNALDATSAAAEYAARRERELRLAREAVQLRQREAAERAATLLAAREEDTKKACVEMQRRMANVEAVGQVAAVERKAPNISTRSIQARRSMALKQQEEEEFEALFLRGPVSPRSDSGSSLEGRIFERRFPLATVSSLMPDAEEVSVPLSVCPFVVTPIGERGRFCGDGKEDAHVVSKEGVAEVVQVGAGESVEEDDVPCINTTTSDIVHFRTPLPPLWAYEEVPPYMPCGGSSCESETQGMRESHRQFLLDLKMLQEKLARAMRNTEGDETQYTSDNKGNVSVSATSSGVSPECYQRSVDEKSAANHYGSQVGVYSTTNTDATRSSNGSSVTSVSSEYLRSYPTMTTEQLKAALLKMRMRMRSSP
ncbi:hypothetical protein ERJ75_001451300 [Trypanosoma vivax]|uniref:Uncharacterized protein n=1 Tax=Trypanosoma vivax (strain Y486) TaxID=1055687 RepID=G0TW56_TRYVY|nr:hypothetical protein ERJ75_001451300 [Trypanosoma vivax]CCC48172.1 conserved hypothetical protein [Trypanosoma vivax Y486]